jgi:hypothetical protein
MQGGDSPPFPGRLGTGSNLSLKREGFYAKPAKDYN